MGLVWYTNNFAGTYYVSFSAVSTEGGEIYLNSDNVVENIIHVTDLYVDTIHQYYYQELNLTVWSFRVYIQRKQVGIFIKILE